MIEKSAAFYAGIEDGLTKTSSEEFKIIKALGGIRIPATVGGAVIGAVPGAIAGGLGGAAGAKKGDRHRAAGKGALLGALGGAAVGGAGGLTIGHKATKVLKAIKKNQRKMRLKDVEDRLRDAADRSQ